jgi:thiol-disulfide isomerase/thioredoxin
MNYKKVLPVLTLITMFTAAGCQTTDPVGTKRTDQVEQASNQIAEAGEKSSWGQFQRIKGAVPAPEFPDGLDWLNTREPLSIAILRGKVVILDFWTYGCINCMHIIPDLKRLKEEYPDELVVIGVHSAKFSNEQVTENIQIIINRYELGHPVVNDNNLVVARMWNARYWPTLALIDPAGNVVGMHSGEGVYMTFKPEVDALVREFDSRGGINREPVVLRPEGEKGYSGSLSFPGKVLADERGKRIFIADSNHHRIIAADIMNGQVLDVVGGPNRGYRDGSFENALFDTPQGMALTDDGAILFVADTGNHSIRKVDLIERELSTLLGTGTQASVNPPLAGTAPDVALQSPWDIELQDNILYIAMAGSHQIWSVDLSKGDARPFAGSGIEGVRDDLRTQSELAQPSGLTLDGRGRLYFADSESSSIRKVDTLKRHARVVTIAGGGPTLFDFGDTDGRGQGAQFQHPLGIVFYNNNLYVADTYNSKIKKVDLDMKESITLFGTGHGFRDGDDPLFYEPGGIDAAFGNLYIADTNNHSVRVIDLTRGVTSTLRLMGTDMQLSTKTESIFGGELVELTPLEVRPGPSHILIDVRLPQGYKLNPDTLSTLELTETGNISIGYGPDVEEVIIRHLPFEMDVVFGGSSGFIQLDLYLVYCKTENEDLCFLESIRVLAPVSTAQNGAKQLHVLHSVELPLLEEGFFSGAQ